MNSENNTIYIVSDIESPRLHYILRFLFNGILQREYMVIKEPPAGEPCIFYGNPEPGEISMYAHTLLFKEEVKQQEILTGNIKGIPSIFNGPANFTIPFDLFTAAFYLLSRYEEYLPFHPDQHNRFPVEESIAYKNNFHQRPVVDEWAMALKEIVREKFPGFHFPAREFKHIPTFDIDQLFAYKHKGLYRTLAAAVRDGLYLKWGSFFRRWRTLAGISPDMYNTYDAISESLGPYNLNPVWFIHCGNYSSFDKQVDLSNHDARKIFDTHFKDRKVGIHPSYQAYLNQQLVNQEIMQLERLIGEKVVSSRFHYLRLKLPESYHVLIGAGIKEDYTLGWPSVPGFRPGTCTPFPFFDLLQNKELPLVVFPFQIMDASLRVYMKLGEEGAIAEISGIIKKIKAVNGTLITLWHNESFSEKGIWTGWRKVWQELLKQANG